ncbi:MAG: B12-binding domain-containing radical SAM protein [Rhodospirillaceae bacterium]
MTAATLSVDQTACLEHLRKRINGYSFHEGAVLINVPLVPVDVLDGDVARNRGYFAYPPTTQLYLSAILRSLNVESIVLDLNFVLLDEARKDQPDLTEAWTRALDEALAHFDKPLVCVSLMFESTYEQYLRICRHVRQVKPGACIAAGGVAATADPEKLLADGSADLVFLHEGERPLAAFYGFLDGTSEKPPFNLAFRDETGVIRRLESVEGGPVEIDIREDYRKIDVAAYCQVGSLSSLSRMQGIDVPYASVLSRRGCRARCSFCGVRNFNGKGVRVREAVNVVDEMRHLHDVYGVRYFDWLDDDLLYDRSAALALFREIAERLPGIAWGANNGLIAAAIDAEIMEAMQASGCIAFKIGLESGNAEVLRAVHKPTNLDRFFQFAKLSKDFPGLFVLVNLIMGFPGETIRQMRDSFVTSVRGGLDWNSFYVYQHLKNTELYLNYGSVSGSVLETDYSKDGQTPTVFAKDNNPVRGAAFRDMELETDLVRNYDVFTLPDDLIPSREQLKEVWFTYNLVSNFLLNPAYQTSSDVRLANAVRWQRALQQAYLRDAAMAASLYFLEWRLGHLGTGELEALRGEALRKLNQSPYWQQRDRAFGFSSMLDRQPPAIDPRCSSFITTP